MYLGCNARMDLQAIRRENLRAYMAAKLGGVEAELARCIGRSPSQTSDMLAGRKSFGEKVARDIEKKLQLEQGELDRDATAPFSAPAQAQTITATLERLRPQLEAATPAVREAAGRLLLSYAQDPTDGTRIAQALEALLAKQEKPTRK
jgi:hypothetical protein